MERKLLSSHHILLISILSAPIVINDFCYVIYIFAINLRECTHSEAESLLVVKMLRCFSIARVALLQSSKCTLDPECTQGVALPDNTVDPPGSWPSHVPWLQNKAIALF